MGRSENCNLTMPGIIAASFLVSAHAFDCGSPAAGPVLNGVDLVATFTNALDASGMGGGGFNLSIPTQPPKPPVIGSSAHSFTDAEGFTFYFVSEENKQMFMDTPEKFPVGA